MQVIAKRHKAIIQDIVCNTNAESVAVKKRKVQTFANLTTVTEVTVKRKDTKTVVIALNISVVTLSVQTPNNTVLHTP